MSRLICYIISICQCQINIDSGSLFRGLILLAASLFLAVTPARAAKINIAVLGEEPTEPARSLLIAELSKLPDVQVIERTELEKIASEQSLQANGLTVADSVRIGKLLHADALLLLTTGTNGKQLSVRAMAVAQGVTLSETSYALPLPEPPKWAGITSRKLAPFLASFSTNTTPRIPLSILKIHSVNAGSSAEKELAFLLARRLMNEPSLWVLERSQMGLLEWENALKANPQATYWTGSYLLDGAFTSDSAGYTISARLRPAQQGDELRLTATGPDLLAATESLAREVTASLKVQHGSAVWDRTGEAQQYYEEALWAYRWFLYDEASQASEAAWALGLRNDTLALLRFTSEAIHLHMTVSADGDTRVPPKPPAWAFESATVALDRLQEGLAWKKEDLSADWVGMAASCLSNCSQTVACSYYNDLDPSEMEVVKSLRQRLREITDSLKAAGARFPLPRPETKSVGFSLPAFATSRSSLYEVRVLWGPLWQESATASIEEMKKVFDEMDQIADPRIRARVKNLAIIERPRFAPWLAYWDETERARVPLSALKKALLQSPSPERPMDVALINLERRSHVFLDVYSDHFDADQSLAAIVDVEAAIWDSRAALARQEIAIPWYEDAMDAIHTVVRKTDEYTWPKIDAGLIAFQAKLYQALLTEQIADDGTLHQLEPQISEMTTEQKRELLPFVREAFARTKSKRLGQIATAYESDAKIVDGSISPPAPDRNSGEYLHPAWSASYQQLLGGEHMNFAPLRWRGGRIYTCGTTYDSQARRATGLFFIYDPKTSQSTRLVCPLPVQGYSFLDIEVLNDDIYALIGNKLIRHSAAQDRWEEIPGVMGDFAARMIAIDGIIYIYGNPGNITRFTPATSKIDILAASRRRPAQTILDDCAPYGIAQVFKDKENRLCTLLGDGRFLCYDEAKSDWMEINSVEKSLNTKPLDHDLFLRAIGPEGMLNIGGSFMNTADAVLGLLVRERIVVERKLADIPKPKFNFPPPRLPKEAQLASLQYFAQGTGSFDGTDLWILSADPVTRHPVLKRLPPNGQSEQIIPIEVQAGNRGPIRGYQFVATSDGIFIFDRNTASFFKRSDLLAWPQAGKKEAPKSPN